ncbi:MAG TPA: GNAT family N-acetyltransferase [Solirubrobacterales bacterium]|nr:GNAT family N-acetyltransferase [Solirubrobacterales bacterium]
MPAEDRRVHRATAAEAPAVARLLHDFNSEFGVPTPAPAELAPLLGERIASGEAIVHLANGGGAAGAAEPLGLAVTRLRPSLFSQRPVAYLEELYVAPPRRGEGLGRALLEAVVALAREIDAERVELGTSTGDVAARGLYESAGFTNLEDGDTMLFYELEL